MPSSALLLPRLVAFASLIGAPVAAAQESEPALRPREPDASRELAAIEADLVHTLLERRPWLARERGLAAGPPGLGRYGSEAAVWWANELERAEGRLVAVPTEALPPARRADLEAYRAWVRAESLLAHAFAPERWDPVSYVERVERVLRGLTESDGPDVVERAKELHGVLVALPGYWADARRSLVVPARIESEEAVRRLAELARVIHERLHRSFAEVEWGEPARSEFGRRRELASTATFAFREWLRTGAARTGGRSPALGEASWGVLIEALTGTALEADEIAARLLRDIGRMDRELGERRRLQPPERRVDDVESRIAGGARLAMELAERSGLLEPPPIELVVRRRMGTSAPGPHASLRADGAARYAIDVELEGAGWPPLVTELRRALLGPDALRAIGMRFGLPGEALLAARARERPTPGQALLWNRSVVEGFGLYALDWLPRVDWVENPLAADADLAAAMVRERMAEALRLFATIAVHVEGLSEDEAVESLRRVGGYDPGTARREVSESRRDPLRGVGLVGLWELLELERSLARSLPADLALGRTLRLVSGQPAVRPLDIRRNVLAEDSR